MKLFFAAIAFACTLGRPYKRSWDPISQEDVDATNSALGLLIKQVNGDISNIVRNGSFDPLSEVLASDSVGSNKTCFLETTYELTDLEGLSEVQIKELSVVHGMTDDIKGLIQFVLRGGLDPVDLSLHVKGSVKPHCLIPFPKSKISGKVSIKALSLVVSAETDISNADGLVIERVEIPTIEVDFSQIDVDLNGFSGALLQPILNLVKWAVRGKVKSTIQSIAQTSLREQVETAIKDKLPFVVPLPVSSLC